MGQILTCLVSLGFLVEKWPFCSTLMAILAILAIYGPYGHDQRLNQYARYGYPGKEHTNTNSIVLRSAQSDNPIRSYDCFTILGQIYIVKMAIFDQFYHHRKEWSYRDFKDIFGNGMSWGTKWRRWCVEVARVQIVN